MKTFLTNILTEPNNETYCPARFIALLGTLQGLVTSAYDVFWQHAHFDLQAFGVGLSAVLAALGVALGYKKDS